MKSKPRTNESELRKKLKALRAELQEARETLRAIRSGEVDALVVEGPEGEQIFSLKSAEQPYRLLVEQMQEGAATCTPDGTILYSNQRFAQMLNTPMEELVGQCMGTLVVSGDRRALARMLAASGQGAQGTDKQEFTLRAVGWGNVPAYLSAKSLMVGEERIICLVATDLTERKRNEQIVAEERLARSILEQAADAIIVCDPDGVVIRISQAAQRYCATPPIGRHFDTAFALETQPVRLLPGLPRDKGKPAPSTIPFIGDALMGAEACGVDAVLRGPDGQAWQLVASAAPLHNTKRQLLGCVVTLTDITERKRAEEHLAAAHAETVNEKNRLEAVMEALPVGVAILDAKGGNVRSNNMFEIIWGGPCPATSEISDYAAYKAWWPDTGKAVQPGEWASAQAVQKGKTVVGQLMQIDRFDGKRAFVMNSAAPILDAEGKVAGCAVVILDITERFEAEELLLNLNEELAASEQHLRLSQRVAGVGTFEWDIQANVNWWSAEMEMLYGLPPGSFGGTYESWAACVHPDDRAQAERAGQEALKTGALDAEWRAVWPDGSVRWMAARGRVVKDDSGRPLKMIGANIDITERKQAEQKLFEIHQRLQALMDALPVGVSFSDDATCQRITGNPAVLAQFEARPEDNLSASAPNPSDAGRKVRFFREGREISDAELPLQRAVAENREIPPIELEVELPSGRRWFADVSGAPLHDERGKVIGGVAVTVDITRRQAAEQALLETGVELARSNKDLEEFAYVASHDLNEPLRMVTSFLALLQKRYQGKLDSNADEYIGFAVEGGMRMQKLIEDLLAYSRVGTRGQTPEPTDASEALRRVLDDLQFVIADNQAVVTCDDLPTVMADRTQLMQLLQNLIGNGLKFRRQDEPPRVHIGVQPAGEMWEFSIRDNGIGMEAEHFERVFMMFQRLHTREQYAGTGMGLAICKKIVERHGGRIWVESEPGKGSTFFFTMAKG